MGNEKRIDFLRALEVFLAVAEQRSMTQAARSLGMAQSAVSQLLQQLETELGRTLLDRSVRPLVLTSAGNVLCSRATRLLADATETRTTVQSLGTGALPQLRLAVIGSLAGTLVPPLVTALVDRLSIDEISVLRGPATTSENALLNRNADMLITSDALYDVDGLDRLPLFREPYILALPRDSIREPEMFSLQRLADRVPFIRYSRHTQMGWAIESQLKRLGANLPSKLTFDSNEDVLAMVAAGRGWTITAPSHVLHSLRERGAVHTAPFPGPGFRRVINLMVRSGELGNIASEIHRLCLDVLNDDFAPLVRAAVPWLGNEFEIARHESDKDFIHGFH